LHFGDTSGEHATRLAELVVLVDGQRAGAAIRWARALADGDGTELVETFRDFEAMGDQLAAADTAAQAVTYLLDWGRIGLALAAQTRAARIACAAAIASPALAALPVVEMPLSPTEYAVAVQVADVLSNKQIAGAQTVSIRTVEGHIYRSCNKLAVTNRTELAKVITEYRGSAASD
jgi:DNA-binding NarL/FixJ family response regulator